MTLIDELIAIVEGVYIVSIASGVMCVHDALCVSLTMYSIYLSMCIIVINTLTLSFRNKGSSYYTNELKWI